MITSNTQPKWALIGVRVCAICLALWAIVAIVMAFIGVSNGIFTWLQLVFIPGGAILVGFTALRLWQLRPWSRGATIEIFAISSILSGLGLTTPSNWNSPATAIILCMMITIGIIGSIFLTRPAVKALFQNQQSAINNQKSPNA